MPRAFEDKDIDFYKAILIDVQSALEHRMKRGERSCSSSLRLVDLTLKETQILGQQLALQIKHHSDRPWLFTLDGDMGTGKTTLIKALAKGLGYDEQEIQSPTFSFLAILEKVPALFHFDLYRLKANDDFESLGFQEYLQYPGICCIEWAEKIDLRQYLHPRPHLDLALQFGRKHHLRNIELLLRTADESF